MTPKEKAKELVDKYHQLLYYDFNINLWINECKQCEDRNSDMP